MRPSLWPSSHAWSTARGQGREARPLTDPVCPAAPGGRERALPAHLHTERPRCPRAAGPGPRAPGRSSCAGPPPGRGQAARPLPAAEGTLQGRLGTRGPQASLGGARPRPGLALSQAHPAPELQTRRARSRMPPGPPQLLLLGEGHPAPCPARLAVTAKRLISVGSKGLWDGADLTLHPNASSPSSSRSLSVPSPGLPPWAWS